MRLFGKKANTQSEIADVPPELRPYYREQAIAAHAHRTALRFLILFLLLSLLVGIGTWSWLHRKSITHVFTTDHTTIHQAQTPLSTASTSPSAPPSPSASASDTPSPTSSATITPTPVSTTDAQQTPTTSPSTSPSPESATIPNTGPGETVLGVAFVVGLISFVLYHVRLRRLLRR